MLIKTNKRTKKDHNQSNIGTVSKATLGKPMRDRMRCVYMGFLSVQMPSLIELGWTCDCDCVSASFGKD